jgi:hypothetical protein
MKLVTFDEGRVGRLDGDTVVELDVPTTRSTSSATDRSPRRAFACLSRT